MKEFPSIETVFVREPKTNKLDLTKLRNPEYAVIKDWTVSEKVDGTNIRAIVTLKGIEVRGRTDKAQLPPGTNEAVLGALPSHQAIFDYFTAYRGKELPEQWSVTLYGEAYGAGIQKGGHYSESKRFRVFDLLLGENWWTDDREMRRVCGDLGIPTMPCVGMGNIEAERFTSRVELDGYFPSGSVVAQQDRNASGVQAEGIVVKPTVVLLDRHGDRVLWKITYRDLPQAEMRELSGTFVSREA